MEPNCTAAPKSNCHGIILRRCHIKVWYILKCYHVCSFFLPMSLATRSSCLKYSLSSFSTHTCVVKNNNIIAKTKWNCSWDASLTAVYRVGNFPSFSTSDLHRRSLLSWGGEGGWWGRSKFRYVMSNQESSKWANSKPSKCYNVDACLAWQIKHDNVVRALPHETFDPFQ